MKEHPILFSGEMVRAILAGKKTQTRRVVKVIRDLALQGDAKPINTWAGKTVESLCPYGQIGDRLWVRETWAKTPDETRVIFRADYPVHSDTAEVIDIPTGRLMPLVWKPSIHLPRKFSRITLEITGVRVERVQEISDQDAIAEGVKFVDKDSLPEYVRDMRIFIYKTLWNILSAKRGYSWNSNPWVWVIEFRKVEK